MKIGMEVKSREQSSKLEKVFQSIHPLPPFPHPPNPLQSANFADFGPIWMKLGMEVKNDKLNLKLEPSSNPEFIF